MLHPTVSTVSFIFDMNITLICIGKLKDRFFEDAASEYLKRLQAYAKVSVIEVKAEQLPDNPASSQICAALEKEASAIIKKIPVGSEVIPMCIEGVQYSSENFARLLDSKQTSGISSFTFVIGGSYGLHDSVKSLGKVKLSMSEMTFPHRLARIMLLEQIYRACKINAGEKYHK